MLRAVKSLRHWFLRRFVFRRFTIGPGFYAGKGVRLWAKHGIRIGVNFYMGRNSQIECDAEIGDNVIFANQVSLVGRYDHHFQTVGVPIAHAERIRWVTYQWKGLHQKVVIGDDVWLGLGVIVLAGVQIGEGSIVAAGSVVTKDVEPYSIYAGVPARKVADRFESIADKDRHLEMVKRPEARVRFSEPIRYES